MKKVIILAAMAVMFMGCEKTPVVDPVVPPVVGESYQPSVTEISVGGQSTSGKDADSSATTLFITLSVKDSTGVDSLYEVTTTLSNSGYSTQVHPDGDVVVEFKFRIADIAGADSIQFEFEAFARGVDVTLSEIELSKDDLEQSRLNIQVYTDKGYSISRYDLVGEIAVIVRNDATLSAEMLLTDNVAVLDIVELSDDDLLVLGVDSLYLPMVEIVEKPVE